jgi:hypothetical protein
VIVVHQEIPSEQWPRLVDQFGRLHRSKAVRITLIDPVAGAHLYASDQPLLGLVDERHGQGDESITVMWGGTGQGAASHRVQRPARISMSEWNDAYSAKLEIESADGVRLVIEAGPRQEVLPPGLVTDGVPVSPEKSR